MIEGDLRKIKGSSVYIGIVIPLDNPPELYVRVFPTLAQAREWEKGYEEGTAHICQVFREMVPIMRKMSPWRLWSYITWLVREPKFRVKNSEIEQGTDKKETKDKVKSKRYGFGL